MTGLMLKNNTNILFRINELRNEFGTIKSYLGEGSYEAVSEDGQVFIVFQTDILQYESTKKLLQTNA
jgi:hypothetical protein